jgi:UDP-3-O-[3-hydroxymyristoyl] glucosamine N-acyltransferase
MEFSVAQIAQILGAEVEGDEQQKIKGLGKIEEAKAGDIAFLANPKYENYIYETHATAVIVSKEFKPKKALQTTLIKVDDPYSSFSALLDEYQRLTGLQKSGVEQPAFMAESAQCGENIYRGAFSYIGENVRIGNNVKIYPHVYIGDNTTIADGSILYAGVKVYANSVIGKHCTIQAGAVIGSEGFGYAPQKDGTYKPIPQVGNVILEDYVDIGANTTIDCATMGSTIIRRGTKIDNQVQIAHNVEIGHDTAIASQCGISGSTKIGNNCVLAGQVGLVGHIKIGDQSIIAAKSGVSKSFPKTGSVVFGYPAMDKAQYVKSFAIFRNLPELREKVMELEKKC